MESDEEPNGLTAEIWWPLISPQLDSIGDREVQQTAANRVRAILGRLCFDALTAFEFSLTSSSPKATPEGVLPDISQKIERPDQAEHLLKRWGCSSGGWTELLGNWASARRSSESDSIVSPGILGSVRSIWLEFDLGRSPEPQRLALFGGQIDRAAQAAALNRCVDMLPPAARTMYLFDLSARSIGWVRLEIVGVSVPEMPSYLDKIGVSPPRWLEVLGPAGRESDRPHLSFGQTARSDPGSGSRSPSAAYPTESPAGWS